jgi:hypothetical protein
LTRIAQFLEVSTTAEMLQCAITNSSNWAYAAIGKEQQDQWIATKKHRKDIPFVRVRKAGGWRTISLNDPVRLIETAWET